VKTFKLIAATVFFIALGFTAERVKVSLNHYLDYGAQISGFDHMLPAEREEALAELVPVIPYDYYYNHKKISVYHRFSIRQLAVFKWGFALLLVGIYLFAGLLFLGWMDVGQAAKNHLHIYVAIALLIAVFFFVVSRIHPNPTAGYAVARKVLGFLHSPLPLILAVFTSRMRGAFS
jgi:uncharacterized membrane protein